jgi:hypothetical protein
MIILLLAFAVLIGSFSVLTWLATWLSSKGPILRNIVTFCLAGGAAYSVSAVIGFWMDVFTEHIPAENMLWPTVIWSIIAVICGSSAIRAKGSPYAFALPFFLSALIVALSPYLPTFPDNGSSGWFFAVAIVLGFFGTLPISRWSRLIAVVALQIYLFTVVCAIPYFNWRVAKEDGFINWLFLGEITATGKAAIWPCYAIAGLNRQAAGPAVKSNVPNDSGPVASSR